MREKRAVHRWTVSEVELVRKLADEGKTVREIADRLELTTSQVGGCITNHQIVLKLRHSDEQVERPWTIPWTDTELMLLTLLRQQRKTWAECADFLGRTVGDCRRTYDRHPDYFAERSFLCRS